MALPDLIAVEDLFGPPERSGASISPDGTRIAYLAPWKNRLNVWVQDLDSDTEAWCVTAYETRSVLHHGWTDDPRFLLYLQDAGGDENWHLYRVDLDAPDAPAVDLTPFPGVRVLGFELPVGRPGTAILQLNNRKIDEIDLHELDIATGELTLLAENPGHVQGWLYAGHGEVIARTLTDDGDIVLSRFDAEAGALHPFVVFEGADYPLSVAPLEPSPDGTGVWVGSNRGTDQIRLVRIDVATGAETEVDSHPSLDLDGARRAAAELSSPLIRDRRTGELIGARYLGERQVIHALDRRFAEVLENLAKLSDGDLAELSSDERGQRWVVSFTHDRDPGVTWLYDHATGESRLLFRPYPRLDPEVSAPMT
jgi:dipeptidyl aminopeptidase/acylaminoacyl peptidase